MDPANKINLIQNRTEVSPQLVMVIALLRRLSLWVLVIFIVSGILVGGMYYYFSIRNEELAAKQQQLSQVIAQSTRTEGLLVSVTQRAALTKKILDIQKPVGMVFDTVVQFVSPGKISNISFDDTDTVSLMVHVNSIPEGIFMTDDLVNLAAMNLVRKPQLVSFSIGPDGSIDMGLSFVAVF